jgi:dihydrofolate synthase/folylpolyglutamate synthase
VEYSEAVAQILGFVDTIGTSSPSGLRSRYDLSQMEHFLDALGNPHNGRVTAHIAGTKGKGSTSAMTSSILEAGRYSAGLFTSPHLHSFCERIKVGNKDITKQEFADLVEKLLPIREKTTLEGRKITLFELLTAMAFSYFQYRNVSAQVLEVGLGGRLDSTNVVIPDVCGITSLGLDHTEVLGDTIAKIASEKGGIIKAGVPVVCASQETEALEVLKDIALNMGSPFSLVGEDIHWDLRSSDLTGQRFVLNTQNDTYDLKIPLLGEYQIINAAVSVGMIEHLIAGGLEISKKDIEDGLSKVEWPCRMEVLQEHPLLIADGAHNPHAAHAVVGSIRKLFPGWRIKLIVGIQSNHDADKLIEELSILSPYCVFATRSRHPRAIDSGQLYDMFESYDCRVYKTESVSQALDMCFNETGSNDLIIAIGSLFVAAEVREIIKNIPPEDYPVFNAQRNA